MIYIRSIEIQYFRSIYRQVIRNLKDMNVLTGKNDAGKSNVLKALNLFFNSETEIGFPINFAEDFNKTRLTEVRQTSIKGKQFIQIKITFERGTSFSKTLPTTFTVTKKWLRDDVLHPSIVTDNVQRRMIEEGGKYTDRSKSSLTQYLGKIKYFYIPAIKDSKTFDYLLKQLQETLYNDTLTSDQNIREAMLGLSDKVSRAASELNKEFKDATGIDAIISSPQNITDLYRTLEVITSVDVEKSNVSLDRRGDGIRIRYLPSILNFISRNSTRYFVWGFEEPENSLEYNMASSMADCFVENYSKNSMILLTTHSAAFFNKHDRLNVQAYRCFSRSCSTSIKTWEDAHDDPAVTEELGLAKLQEELFREYKKKIEDLLNIKSKLSKYEQIVREASMPVVFTEGVTDEYILKTAWSRLYEAECPFIIKSCDIIPPEEGSVGGCGMLKSILTSHRHDERTIIGIFDRDEDGIASYALDANFEAKGDYKVSRHGKAFAFLLPIPAGKEEYARFRTLTIEFYFEEEELGKNVDGKALSIVQMPLNVTCGRMRIETRESNIPYLRKVANGKKFFAQSIVPTFPKESFGNFKLIFNQIADILGINLTEKQEKIEAVHKN